MLGFCFSALVHVVVRAWSTCGLLLTLPVIIFNLEMKEVGQEESRTSQTVGITSLIPEYHLIQPGSVEGNEM